MCVQVILKPRTTALIIKLIEQSIKHVFYTTSRGLLRCWEHKAEKRENSG